MSMQYKKFREHGQATMEIAAAAVAILFVVIGFFTIGSVGVVSIKSLLLTREAAETKAADETGNTEQFTASGNSASSSDTDWDSKTYSNAEDKNYVYLCYQNTPGIMLQSAVYSTNAAELAMLSTSGAVLPQKKNSNEQMSASGAFDLQFRDGWLKMLNAKNIDITKWDSSSVSYPAFGTRK